VTENLILEKVLYHLVSNVKAFLEVVVKNPNATKEEIEMLLYNGNGDIEREYYYLAGKTNGALSLVSCSFEELRALNKDIRFLDIAKTVLDITNN
jgi:hypothetical protein